MYQVSTKDVFLLQESLRWELIAAKKASEYAAATQDPLISQAFTQIGLMHQNHFQRLLNHLRPQEINKEVTF